MTKITVNGVDIGKTETISVGYEPLKGDPAYVAPKLVDRGKYKKVLTKTKRGSIIKRVFKINKRKDDNKMTDTTTPKAKKSKSFDWRGAVKSIAWLIEAGFRGFVGWILLSNFDNLAATSAAIYALGTAGIIIVMHFVRANRK